MVAKLYIPFGAAPGSMVHFGGQRAPLPACAFVTALKLEQGSGVTRLPNNKQPQQFKKHHKIYYRGLAN
jgi:hypothetical protein